MPLIDVVTSCESCGVKAGEKHRIVSDRPTMDDLEFWTYDGVAEATDGCQVEPDGICYHGHRSWLLVYGLI